jgi:hypothetical protein
MVLSVRIGLFGLGLALPLVLLRLRRVAASVSLLVAALLAVVCANLVYTGTLGQPLAFSLVGYAIETVALLGSAGPRRGLELLTWRGWALTVVSGICVGVAWLAFVLTTFDLAPHRGLYVLRVTGGLGEGIAAVVVGGAILTWVAVRSALGRKLALLFALPLYVLLVTSAAFLIAKPVSLVLLTYLPPLAVAGLSLRAVLRSRRNRTDGEPA